MPIIGVPRPTISEIGDHRFLGSHAWRAKMAHSSRCRGLVSEIAARDWCGSRAGDEPGAAQIVLRRRDGRGWAQGARRHRSSWDCSGRDDQDGHVSPDELQQAKNPTCSPSRPSSRTRSPSSCFGLWRKPSVCPMKPRLQVGSQPAMHSSRASRAQRTLSVHRSRKPLSSCPG